MSLDAITTLLPGLVTTLFLWATIMVIGIPCGLVMGYVLNQSRFVFRVPVLLVSQVGRGFPALVTLYLVYFGLPEFDMALSATTAAVAAFSLTTASYLAEIFRSALAAVPTGQKEAATALGVPWHSRMAHVVLPQALKMVITPVIGFAVIVLQGTSLAYTVGVRELLAISFTTGTVTFSVFNLLALAGLFYLAVYLVLTGTTTLIRKRTEKHRIRVSGLVG